jgi:hypothetical protein
MSSMTPDPPDPAEIDRRGIRWLSLGGGLGCASGIAILLLPSIFLWVASHAPSGILTIGPHLVTIDSILVLAGALLLVLSLFLYRRAFATLRKSDERFRAPWALSLIGTLGVLFVLATSVIVLAYSDSIPTCLGPHGVPSFSCLQAHAPWAVTSGLIGFWLTWLGVVGIVTGLSLAGRRFRAALFSTGAALYAILLLVLVGPFLAALRPFPGSADLLLGASILAVLAPALVLAAASGAQAAVRS